VEVLQLVNDTRTNFVRTKCVVTIRGKEHNVESNTNGWAVSCVTEWALVKLTDANKGLLTLALNPVLSPRCVWLIAEELNDDGLVLNTEASCVRGVCIFYSRDTFPSRTDNAASSGRCRYGCWCRSWNFRFFVKVV
jgi:hypothetical protein